MNFYRANLYFKLFTKSMVVPTHFLAQNQNQRWAGPIVGSSVILVISTSSLDHRAQRTSQFAARVYSNMYEVNVLCLSVPLI